MQDARRPASELDRVARRASAASAAPSVERQLRRAARARSGPGTSPPYRDSESRAAWRAPVRRCSYRPRRGRRWRRSCGCAGSLRSESSRSKKPGKLTATRSASSISTPSRERERRRRRRASRSGGRRGCRSALRGAGPARRGRGSRPSVAIDVLPSARSASTVASIRSVSFARSSSAPRTTLSPCAQRCGQREQRELVDERAAPPRRRCSSRRARAECTSRSPPGSPPMRARGCRRRRGRPSARGSSSSPVRVGLRLTPWMCSSEPGTSVAADDERRGRGDVAGHLDLAERRAARPPHRDAVLPPRDPSTRRLEHQLGVVAGRRRLDDRRLARRVEAREQNRRLHLRARDGQLVGRSTAAAGPRCRSAACPSSVSTPAPMRASGSVTRSIGRALKRGVARQLELLPVLTCEDSREEPDEGAGVRAIDRPPGRDEPV